MNGVQKFDFRCLRHRDRFRKPSCLQIIPDEKLESSKGALSLLFAAVDGEIEVWEVVR